MKIGNTLKELRKDGSLTQVEVAKVLSISRVTYNRYEADLRQPDYDTLLKIADFYNVEVGFFFYPKNASNKFKLLRYTFRDYLNNYKKVVIKTDELRELIRDGYSKDDILYLSIFEELKNAYTDTEAEAINVRQLTDLVPFKLHVEKSIEDFKRKLVVQQEGKETNHE